MRSDSLASATASAPAVGGGAVNARKGIFARAWSVGVLEATLLIGCAAFYGVFIARSALTIGGRAYYALIDDSMISLTVARNFADGHGLVWRVGQHVEGYTNFLWTLWMAVLHFLPFSEPASGLPVMISGALILLATMLVVRSICRVLVPDRPLVAVAAMALTGLSYPLVYWSLRGMEAGLAALLVTGAVRIALDIRTEVTNRRLCALAVLLSAAVLTRDDLIVPAVVVLAFSVWRAGGARRRVAAILTGALVLTIVGHTVFRLAYYGDALPNTYYLKVTGVSIATRLHRGAVGVVYTLLTSLFMPAALAVVALLSARGKPRFPALLFLAAVVVAESVYSVAVGGDYAEELAFANRFITTVIPLLMVLAACGAGDVLERAGTARARLAGAAVGVLLVVAAAVLQSHGWGQTHLLEIFGAAPYAHVRLAVALVAGALLVYLLVAPIPRAHWLPAAMAGALLLLTLAAIDYAPVRYWTQVATEDPKLDQLDIQRALILRHDSSPSTVAAFVEAGDWAYFSHRPGVDLLGKSDPVIAHGPNHPIVFKPGHTKWNYAYSVGQLRPDVVTELFLPTRRDACNMARWGYRQIAGDFWVRDGARGVRVADLARDLASTYHTPFLPVAPNCATRG